MRKKLIHPLFVLILLLSLLSVEVRAKDMAKLEAYLRSHQVVLRFGPDSTLVLSDSLTLVLDERMNGKTLLVAADGGSHYLKLNGHVNLLLLRYLAAGKLQYYFQEGARSWAMNDNWFLEGDGVSADEYYKVFSRFTRVQMQLQKDVYLKHAFRYIGVDFERDFGLYAAFRKIMQKVDEGTKMKVVAISPYATDSSYMNIGAATFKKYYQGIQNDFYRDSSQLKILLGHSYPDFAYLLSNPNINTPTGNRDRPMAENLLTELSTATSGTTHLLNCGMAHSRPNVKGTMVNILSSAPSLEKRILVVNLVCDECVTPEEKVSNWAFPFAKGETMEALKRSAAGDIVVYDLSGLQEEFASIREYGDLLIFARGAR